VDLRSNIDLRERLRKGKKAGPKREMSERQHVGDLRHAPAAAASSCSLPFSFQTIITHRSPSTSPSPTHLVRSHLSMPYPMQLLISCHPSTQPKKKKKKSIFKKVVKTWLVPVDVSIVEAVRGVSVLLPSSCRRRVPCVQTHVPTPPLFSSLLFLSSSMVRC
jgi:hypothetical protein